MAETEILGILPFSQTLLLIVVMSLLFIVFWKKKGVLYRKESFPALRNISSGILILAIAYTIKHTGHIFGSEITDLPYLVLEIFTSLFIIYACLDILRSD